MNNAFSVPLLPPYLRGKKPRPTPKAHFLYLSQPKGAEGGNIGVILDTPSFILPARARARRRERERAASRGNDKESKRQRRRLCVRVHRPPLSERVRCTFWSSHYSRARAHHPGCRSAVCDAERCPFAKGHFSTWCRWKIHGCHF